MLMCRIQFLECGYC